MGMVAFDTLKFTQTLRDKAKLPQEQAEGIAQAFAEASGEQLATKSDIAGLNTKIDRVEAGLNAKIDRVESELGAKIDKVESELSAKIDKVESELSAKIDKVESELSAKIDKVEDRLNTKIDKVEAGLNAKIDKVEVRLSGDMTLLKWMLGLVVAGIMALVLKAYFPH